MAWLLGLKAHMKEREILYREAYKAADEDQKDCPAEVGGLDGWAPVSTRACKANELGSQLAIALRSGEGNRIGMETLGEGVTGLVIRGRWARRKIR